MQGKKTMVILRNDHLNTSQEYELDHATRILRMQNNGGWKLPTNSKFKFDQNGIGIRENTNGNEGAEKTANHKQSDSAPKQD